MSCKIIFYRKIKLNNSESIHITTYKNICVQKDKKYFRHSSFLLYSQCRLLKG